MVLRTWKDRRQRVAQDDGFSLVETIVALALAVTVMLGLLATGLFAVRSAVTARQNSAVADLLNREIENARSLDFGAITMVTSDLGTDPRISTGTPRTFNPGTGAEPVDAGASGSVSPHLQNVTTPNGTFQVGRYVTLPSGTVTDANGQPSIRRLTVVATWTDRARTRTRIASTLLTKTRRGLALPRYTFVYNGPAVVLANTPTFVKNPENDLSYGFVLRNQGARDSWGLTASTPALGWRYYVDTDRDGIWSQDATEPELTAAQTPLTEPSGLVYVVAHRLIGGAESGTTTTTFSARSVSQASDPGKSIVTSLTVTAGVATPPTASASPTATASPSPGGPTCTAGVLTSYQDDGAQAAATRSSNNQTITPLYLFNGPGLKDTVTQAIGTASAETSGLQPALCNWATDQQTTQAGRRLVPVADAPVDRPHWGKAEWRYRTAAKNGAEVGGTAVAVLHVQCGVSFPTLTVSLTSYAGGTPTQRVQRTATPPSSCNSNQFVRVDVPLPIPATFTLGSGADDALALTVTTTAAVRLGHGVSGTSSRLVVALK